MTSEKHAGKLYRHIKRGTTYITLGVGELTTDTLLTDESRIACFKSAGSQNFCVVPALDAAGNSATPHEADNIMEATLQTSSPLKKSDRVVIYQDVETHTVWARNIAEFYDSERFEAL